MAIKEVHVFAPILLLLAMGVGVFFLTLLRVPIIASWLILEAVAAVLVYSDSRAMNLRYQREWNDAELASPFWIGVTTLIFAPLGLPLYTYALYAVNNILKQTPT